MKLFLASWLFQAVGAPAIGAEVTNATAGPGSAIVTGTNLLAGFEIAPGFRIEVVASEPMISAPVALAFDENGRLFVVELPASADRHAGQLGRVRVLDNLNEQGVYQDSTIYADSLQWPSAVACYAGGVFVATAPDVLFLKDTKGDAVADARQAVLSGFGAITVSDPDSLPNNFNWGPDNRIHGASARIGGEISSKGSGAPASIDGADFSFDPRTLEVAAETGPAQSGLTFDDNGHEFASDFLRPLLTPMYELRYVARNPYFPKPAGLASAADAREPVYRLAPEQAPTTGGNQRTNLIGPMTMARGCVVYRGRAFPTNFWGNVFEADPEAHLIHRLVVRENGLETTAQRAPDERTREFLVSRDPAFRPVQLVNGPDGALYVADVRQDGKQGRIYRIIPTGLKRSKPAKLGGVKTYDLVSMLAQGDGWHRDTAARLIYERKDPAAPALLRETLVHSRLVQARLLALRALAGTGSLNQEDVLRGLRDSDPLIRQNGLVVSEALLANGTVPEPLLAQFRVLAGDPSQRVRYQLAFTVGALPPDIKTPILAQVLVSDLSSPWMRMAVLSSCGTGAGSLFTAVAASPRIQNDPAGIDFLRQLTLMIGVSGQLDAVSTAINFISRGSLGPALAYILVRDLGEGLYRTRSSLALVDSQGVLQSIFAAALNVATDATQPEAVRISTAQLLAQSSLGTGPIANWLLLVCSPPTTPAIQAAAMETLSRHDDPQVLHGALDLWPLLAPSARVQAMTALLSRGNRVPAVLDAIQNRMISPFDLSSAQKNFLRTYSIPGLRQRALQLLGPVPVARPEVVERFKPALSLTGNIDRGREIFRQRCVTCHLAVGPAQNQTLGPDMLRARTFPKQELLSRIVEPNVAVRPDYATQVVETKEGETMLGIVKEDNRWTLSLMQAGTGSLVWPQLNISSVSPESWSLMPEGLELGLGVQDMADLMEYILRATK